jgi:hypothetical protein
MAEYKLYVKRDRWIRMDRRMYILARLIMHKVEEPVLPIVRGENRG